MTSSDFEIREKEGICYVAGNGTKGKYEKCTCYSVYLLPTDDNPKEEYLDFFSSREQAQAYINKLIKPYVPPVPRVLEPIKPRKDEIELPDWLIPCGVGEIVSDARELKKRQSRF